MISQKDAWDDLYRTQSRPWRGTISNRIPFPFSKNDKILDIGCGNGKSSCALMEEGYDVTGIDISDIAVQICNERYGNRMKAVTASITNIPVPDREFGGAVMIHVLEHLDNDDIEDSVKEIRRVIRPSGKVFVRVFHKDDMRSDNGKMMGGTVIKGNGIMYRYYDETELRDVFSDFSEVAMKRIDETTKFGKIRSRIEAVFEVTRCT